MSLDNSGDTCTNICVFPYKKDYDSNAYGDKFDFSSSSYHAINTTKSNEDKKEGESMDDNDLLKAYIDKINQDQHELKIDIRESEKRTSERLDKIEKRMDDRLNRIEDMINRTNNDSKSSIDEIKQSVESKMGWVIGTCIATILGIAAMVVTVMVS